MPETPTSRRSFLASLAASTAGAVAARDYGPNAEPLRYPDPDIIVLDPSFKKYLQGNTPIRRLFTGGLWCEGPAWNGSGSYLVWSDIPNNRQMRYLPEDNHVSVMRANSNFSNGNTFDFHGRQLSCEHATRRVVRYEPNGRVTVLASEFSGKPFNAPNDIVVHPDGGVWFTDPGYGSMGDYEGNKGDLQLKEAVYRIDPNGRIDKVTDEQQKPNGLCFSPDYKKLYVVDTGDPKNIVVYDVADSVKLGKGRLFVKMNEDFQARVEAVSKEIESRFGLSVRVVRADQDPVQFGFSGPGKPVTAEKDKAEIDEKLEALGRYARFSNLRTKGQGGSDGIRCDVDGNVWSSAGWVGDGYDGVHIFNPGGERIGQIKLPETGSNLCFGGAKHNRLFITAGQSLYSVYVNTTGAHFC